MAILCYQLQHYYHHHHVPVDTESGMLPWMHPWDHVIHHFITDATTELSIKVDPDEFIYVMHSPQSEKWVERTLMYKLSQWHLQYTTYELSAIPGQPKIVEKLRLCSAASKIIIVLSVNSLTEHTFLSEVLQIISNEQSKIIPILYKVSEVQLEKNMIYKSIMTYVTIHHNDSNFDVRLRQALYQ